MFFIILFIISLVAIFILYYGQEKGNRKKLLHSISKSCNIDSVKFEKKVYFVYFSLRKLTRKILSTSKRYFRKFSKFGKNILTSIKKKVRKKLFSEGQIDYPSNHISHIKDEITSN